MGKDIQEVKNKLTLPSMRAQLSEKRIASLVQVSARTEVDDDGNARVLRVEVERLMFVSALVQDECPHVEVPENKTHWQALRAAIARCKKGFSEFTGDDGETTTRRMWRRLGVDDKGVLSYALIAGEASPQAKAWKGEHLLTISIGEKDEAGELIARPSRAYPRQLEGQEKAIADKAYDDVVERFVKERTMLHSDDVRKFVNSLFASTGALCIGGMLHLIPKDGDDAFRRAERALVEAGYQVLLQPIFDGASLGGNVNSGLAAEVANMAREVDELMRKRLEKNKEGKMMRFDTVASRMEKADELKARIALYADIVGDIGDDLQDALGKARNVLRETMSEMANLV